MNLLLPYANNANGKLVSIDNAQKGDKYTCPNCGAELLLKNSKIPEGQKYHRRNHFAHKYNLDNHCSESFLHKLFKEKCFEFLNKKILDKQSLFFSWQCKKCSGQHRTNLLDKIKNVVLECELGICKPDIALLDGNGKVMVVIEVIVAHKPESNVLKYYDDNQIMCLQIFVNNFQDCEKVHIKLLRPHINSVIFCSIPNKKTKPKPLLYVACPTRHKTVFDNNDNLVRFLEEKGNKICKKCGWKLCVEKDCYDQPFLKCENFDCDYKETLSDYDHILFPNLRRD